ncbi:flavodoxin-dependent (E)-4-hydroxy-3-methylbut-2-enyl-diphosphate synthase [Clostridium sediminicola]|uniref:flavodoxin-dependent (E)-4-hydroxy-3-methylbut-2-enyl-diphosphate synthase n=1 Tax=Clostridium sediminicola TaxID=3114879 RepID=UPI0031F227AD
MERRITKVIKMGDVLIGGDSPVSVQSMNNTDTRNVEATIKQIKDLEIAGCDITRCAVLDIEAAKALKSIVNNTKIPVVADIHFDYKLALESIKSGVHGLRLNPGNIGSNERVKMVAREAKARNIPIRIGVNSGSVDKKIIEKYGKICPEALVESALEHVNILESVNFHDIIISIKSSNTVQMVESNRLLSERVDYPLHLGVTEAGTPWRGTIKASIGIGTLLCEGIGDTIRVSLTGDPIEEIKVGKQILKSIGYQKSGVEFISCPTCGRTQIDLIKLAKEAEERLSSCQKNIKVAIMGCIVNGPGEAKEADIGIAGGKGEGLIFKQGKIIKKVKESDLINELISEIEKM